MAIIRLICSLGYKIGNFKDFPKLSDKNEAQKRVFREKLTLTQLVDCLGLFANDISRSQKFDSSNAL